MNTEPVRDLQHALCDILALVQYHMIRSVGFRDCRLRRGARRANNDTPARLDELREEEPNAPRDGMYPAIRYQVEILRPWMEAGHCFREESLPPPHRHEGYVPDL